MRVPTYSRQMRWLIIGYGILVFLWLGPEDNHVWPVVFISMGAAALILTQWLLRRFGGQDISETYILPMGMTIGGIIGLATAVITALLMLFKNARHAHVFPDFPPGLMGAVLERAPVWTIAGSIFGLGVGLLLLAFHTKKETP